MNAPISPPITGLDHALVGVRDLEAARAAYARDAEGALVVPPHETRGVVLEITRAPA